MNRVQNFMKPWQRMLLVLLVCLTTGSNSLWGIVHFEDTDMGMRLVNHPTIQRPFIMIDVLYFDAYNSDSYFDGRESRSDSAAVFVDGNFVCRPKELTWNKDQTAANKFRNTDGWTDNIYETDYCIIRFFDPHHEASSGQAEDRYRIYMYIWLKNWEVGKKHHVHVEGLWRINDDKSCRHEGQTVYTTAFTDPDWSAPVNAMTNYNTVSVSGQLSSSYGPTTVGLYTTGSQAPNGYSTDFAREQSYSKGRTSFENLSTTLKHYDIREGGTLPVQYSLPVKFTRDPDAPNKMEAYEVEMHAYKWFNMSVQGFAYPANVKYDLKNPWSRTLTLKWDSVATGGRNTAGKWKVRNATTGAMLNNGIAYGTVQSDVTLDDYETPNTLQVFFVPTDMDDLPGLLSDSVEAIISPVWNFNALEAKEVEDGIALSWSHNALEDASGSNPYTLHILRTTNPADNAWLSVKDININSKNTIDGSYVDPGSDLEPNKTYYYKLSITVFGAEQCSSQAEARLGGSEILDFTASQGTYSNTVKLQWTVKQVGSFDTNFTIYRRPLGSTKEAEWVSIYSTAGKASSYTYDDVTAQPGTYNDYKVSVWNMEDGKKVIDGSKTADGFCLAQGNISGNITYGTGTAVEGVKVTLKQQDADGDLASGMRSVRLSGYGSGFNFHCGRDTLQRLFSGNFSLQMYICPDSHNMSTDGTRYQLLNVWDTFGLFIHYDGQTQRYRLGVTFYQTDYDSELTVAPDVWTQINCVHDTVSRSTTLYVMEGDAVRSQVVLSGSDVKRITLPQLAPEEECLAIGNNCKFTSDAYFNGYLDEFRFWTKALKESEIQKNYNHPLAGNESGLAIYYPFDEGLEKQSVAYDFSKPDGIPNGYHASTKVPAQGSPMVPHEEQLSLMAYTDANGGYLIRGVPFTGEGSNYSVIPTLGIHEFSPSSRQRFVSMSSLIHSGVDFEDVSSFPVSGKVYYAGTDYPVEGVSLSIDGALCAKDGEPIQTNEQGEFTISVPIGEHFISVSKTGHSFTDGGRYPVDPGMVGVRHNFDREIKNLDFYDETLVNFTGRVVGGDIEGGKDLGFGLSTNNIGVAELVVTPLKEKPRLNVVKHTDGTTFSYDTNADTVRVASASEHIKSESWRGGGADDCRKIFIHTDATTGEFSAMLPPLQYKVDDIKIVKTGLVVGSSTTIDLSNAIVSRSDSLRQNDSIQETYSYHTKLMQTYHSEPFFTVAQDDHEDGAFGISSYTLVDELDSLRIDDIYAIRDGKPEYKYGGAIFEEFEVYTFNIEAFEEYVNYDTTPAVTATTPLKGLVVTIDNALSSDQEVYGVETTVDGVTHDAGELVELQSNQLRLDSLGRATYQWMAGLPNIAAPYTRTIAISYDIDGRTYVWNESGLTGIVLGDLPTGNNFITSGPDMVEMILRDPPGTKSSAEWTSGTVYNLVQTRNIGANLDGHFNTTTKFGANAVAALGAPGAYTVSNLESKVDMEIGALLTVDARVGKKTSITMEATKAIKTSDAMEFVGAPGDIFVGTATNIIFGAANNVGFRRVGASNEATLNVEESISTGMSFGTMFNYTQSYIENMLLPNLVTMRNGMLTTVSPDTIDHFVNTGKYPVYLTTRTPDDPTFGEPNRDAYGNICLYGDSYTFVAPQNSTESYTDSVLWCNNQITSWKDYLAYNEREKVAAFENRENKDSVEYQNFSFDSGSAVTVSESYQGYDNGHVRSLNAMAGVHLNVAWGMSFNKTGVLFDLGLDFKFGFIGEREESTADKTVINYTLAEEGDDNALTVDVYKYGGYGPIFRTRGGQTSAPYEGQVVTKYHQPGTTIMEATMQIEVPQITVDQPVVTDIPTGSTATYTLRLSNASETNELLYYRLGLAEDTNPDGAMLFIDGAPLTDVRTILIQPHETVTKTLLLKQSDQSLLDYERIGIVLASSSQYYPTFTWDVIADTAFISAHFVPSSSPVTLALSNNLMNTQTGTDLVLTMTDFDRNYRGLKAFRMEYKKQGATGWTQIHEYVLDDADLKTGGELLPASGSSIPYTLDMRDFSDGDYLFRIVSASTYGTDEVTRCSEELALVKDMQRPTPIGIPEPTDGILDIGDELSVTFNEDILKGELTSEANFKVTGVLNGAKIDHATALSLTTDEAAAATGAAINLAGKDFALDMWLNIGKGGGTLLKHGTGAAKLKAGINDAGQLTMDISGTAYTSTGTIPTDKWVFLTLSLTADGFLNAAVATDDGETTLFVNQKTYGYEGSGPLTVGGDIKGAIHELLLWDEAHDMTTALLERSKTKNPSTRHLIGYWKMNEGEGTTIRDYARNRHMTMPDETWYLNNENKAVSLDGNHFLSIKASELPVCVDDDYALEFWMRGNAQSGAAQLLQMGDVALSLDEAGTLQLESKDVQRTATSAALADGAWHHVALNVLRQGTAALYVDGRRCLATNAANVGSICTNNLILGARRNAILNELGNAYDYTYDRPFTGQIDEVRVWNATMNGDRLTGNRKVRMTGSEDGLVAYYPFEKMTLDEGNQVVTVGDAADLTGSGNEARLSTLDDESSTLAYTDEAPALRTKPSETNVSFSYVASNDKVVITIDEDAATIEGCTLNITVRDVSDENGNNSVPAVWTVFVNRKELEWQESELTCCTEATNEATVTATIVNKSGTQQMWTLNGMPAWLTASEEYGTTNPLGESRVTFTVSPATPIGKYEETVYLTGNNGIETPLTVNVTITGQVPEWKVNPNDFELSMNVIGRLEIQGVPVTDTDDIVAAFIGEECRGVAHPTYMERYDSYYVTMDIYGNSADRQKVTFRAYDASTGTRYAVIKPDTISFTPLNLVGRYEEPVVLNALDKLEQSTPLKAGWNWVSFYVDVTDRTAPELLEKIADNVIAIKNQENWLMREDSTWGGSLCDTLTNDQMYAIKLKEDCTLRIVGDAVDPADCPITLQSGWNWLGYYGRQLAAVADAMADMNPENGDILKGQTGVTYFANYEWAGSLLAMQPGLGYMIYATSPRQFGYTAAKRVKALNSQPSTLNYFTPIDFHTYSGNAIMAVQILQADELPLANAEVGVFAEDECRACAITDANGKAWLTIPGDEAATLTFQIAVGEQVLQAEETVSYEADAIFGSPMHPLVLRLSGIFNEGVMSEQWDGAMYDLAGRKVRDNGQWTMENGKWAGTVKQQLPQGVYIVNGQKIVVK